jgi:hypothetical protein
MALQFRKGFHAASAYAVNIDSRHYLVYFGEGLV